MPRPLTVEKKGNPVAVLGFGQILKVKVSAHASAPYKGLCGGPKCEFWTPRYPSVQGASVSLLWHFAAIHSPQTWMVRWPLAPAT